MSEVLMLGDLERVRDRVVEVVREGKLVVMPTDTVYAVVADAFDVIATMRVFGAKQRSRDVPLGVVLRSPRQVNGLVTEVSEIAERLMASYWPGPLTLVFEESEGLLWDLGESRGTVGMRMPTEELLIAVTAEIGPLICTTARVPAGRLPYTVQDAKDQIGDLAELYVDGGRRDGRLSTVVDVTRGRYDVLRSGAIPDRHIELVATGKVGWGQQPEGENAEGRYAE
jgi:tRNA threonylcarbamoyl adenosine modification protein (Sua5/YciO/YrdC/YwlC family)